MKTLFQNKPLAVVVFTAFAVRLLVGLWLMQALPLYGYPNNPVSQAGYLFKDAYNRDSQAWQLAQSNRPLAAAFSGEYSSDQYGGLLWLSALVYRYLSPDVQRTELILALTALAGALATFWTYRGVRDWLAGSQPELAQPAALWAAWIVALYPEAVFLGASPMRESFVLAASALALDSLSGPHSRVRRWGGLAAALLLLLAVQLSLAVATAVVLGGFVFFRSGTRLSWRGGLALAAAALGLLLLLSANWQALPSVAGGGGPFAALAAWLQNNFNYQSYLAVRNSGFLQKFEDELGSNWLGPIILAYGALQPVLPAALVEPAPWLWQTINSLRAAGWYLLAPLLLYVLGNHLAPGRRNSQRLWLLAACLGWVLIAAMVAGGDQWDNPRYRSMFLVWMAALAGWALAHARQQRDPWLGRWLAVAGVFVTVFFVWYIGRYTDLPIGFGIYPTFTAAVLACLAVLLGGWYWDRRKKT